MGVSEDLKTPLAEKLADSMKKRISERRINATAALLYLKNPCSYQDDLELLKGDETFQLPSMYIIRKDIENLIKRLHRSPKQSDTLSHASTSGNEINTTGTTANLENEDELQLPLSMIAEDLNLRAAAAAAAAKPNTSLQEELEETLRACKSPFLRVSTTVDRLESLIKKEMDLYECGGSRGKFLQFAYNSLLTLVPTSVESERAFSAAGYIATDIRCRLSDSTLSTLCFLRSYFQNHS